MMRDELERKKRDKTRAVRVDLREKKIGMCDPERSLKRRIGVQQSDEEKAQSRKAI